MTENEAIETLKIQRVFTNSANAKVQAIDKAIQALEGIQLYRSIGTVEEFKALKEYKEKMEMQYLDDMDNPLEPLKLSSALQSEILKYNYRKKHKPQDINILDYTIMYALKHCLEEQLEGGAVDV